MHMLIGDAHKWVPVVRWAFNGNVQDFVVCMAKTVLQSRVPAPVHERAFRKVTSCCCFCIVLVCARVHCSCVCACVDCGHWQSGCPHYAGPGAARQQDVQPRWRIPLWHASGNGPTTLLLLINMCTIQPFVQIMEWLNSAHVN